MRKEALSVRGLALEYGISRDLIAGWIRAGILPAARPGTKRLVVLREDFELCLRRFAVQPRRGHDACDAA